MQNAAGMCCSIAMAAMCFSERDESKLEQDSLVFSAEKVNEGPLCHVPRPYALTDSLRSACNFTRTLSPTQATSNTIAQHG
jgi:hypothetical protein